MIEIKGITISVLILLILSVFGLGFVVEGESLDLTSFAGGEGTTSNPYLIENVNQLQDIRTKLDGHYELIQNIDASETRNWNYGEGFEPIGDDLNPFTGNFNGRGYRITGLYINRGDDDVGLFGYIGGGNVFDLGLKDVEISGEDEVGGIAGSNRWGSIERTYVTGVVNGDEAVGGLVGENKGGIVRESYATAEIRGDEKIGGLVGKNEDSTIENSYSTGGVYGDEKVGGLVGENEDSTIRNSYAAGMVIGTSDTGGLIGENDGGVVINSFWDIETSEQTISDGGTGMTTEDMQSIETYTDTSAVGLNEPWNIARNERWDGEIWSIDEGNDYPRLGGFKENGSTSYMCILFILIILLLLVAAIIAIVIYWKKKQG